MATVVDFADRTTPAPLTVHVLAPDAEPVPAADLARLFPHVRPFSPRFDRLAASSRVVVHHHDRLVGMAVYQRADDELRVPEIAVSGVHVDEISSPMEASD